MLNRKLKGLICAAVTSIMVSSPLSVLADEITNVTDSINGTYNIVVEGFDWGPGITKAIVTMDKEVDNVTKEMFKVEESKNWYAGIENFNRTVVDAYISDENGNRLTGKSNTITIELAVNPDEGNPFLYNVETGRNNWAENYSLSISLTEEAQLSVGNQLISQLNIQQEYIKKELPTINEFKEEIYTKEGDISMNYAYYEPAEDQDKNPLVIWLHGAGEGGRDTTINLLGNKVQTLIEDDIQSQFGGAYVLAPQSPTMWMDTTGNGDYTADGSNIYLSSLMNLIKSYVEANPDIDTNRIYLGGCSNGGYMTMALLLENPEYFAAAYPICEAFQDSWITDEKLEGIKDIPIWFTYALNDGVVNPETNSIATIRRLLDINAKDIKISEFNNVIDTSGLYTDESGNPYEYNGHWSWIYAFNDECKDNDESLWSWLAKQEKQVEADDSEDIPNDDNDDNEETPENSNDEIEDDEKVNEDNNGEDTESESGTSSTGTISNLNTSNKDKETLNKGTGNLPKTGSPISSSMLLLMGAMSSIVGFKLKNK